MEEAGAPGVPSWPCPRFLSASKTSCPNRSPPGGHGPRTLGDGPPLVCPQPRSSAPTALTASGWFLPCLLNGQSGPSGGAWSVASCRGVSHPPGPSLELLLLPSLCRPRGIHLPPIPLPAGPERQALCPARSLNQGRRGDSHSPGGSSGPQDGALLEPCHGTKC